MNIISCENCGVVLDKDKLNFPDNIYDQDGSVDDTKSDWDGHNWVAKVACPVCKADILDTD